MNDKLSKAYYLIPVLYICLTGFFLYLYFGDSVTLNSEIRGIELSTSMRKDNNGAVTGLDNVKIGIQGLELEFSAKSVFKFLSEDGKEKEIELKDVKAREDGITVYFTENIELLVNTKKRDSLDTDLIINSNTRTAGKLLLPIKIRKGYKAAAAGKIPVLTLSGKGTSLFIILPKNAQLDREAGLISIAASGRKSSVIEIRDNTALGLDPLSFWFSRGNFLTQDIETLTKNYIQSAYVNWGENRYNYASGRWSDKKGSFSFSEDIVNALIAESIKKGTYFYYLDRTKYSASLNRESLTVKSSVWTGSLAKAAADQLQKSSAFTAAAVQAAASRNSSFYTRKNMTEQLLSFADENLIKNIIDLGASVNPSSLSIRDSLFILENYIYLLENNRPEAARVSQLADIAYKKILPSILLTDAGLFIESRADVLDTFLTAFAGRLLTKLGSLTDNEIYSNIGKTLTGSVLQLADAKGFIPAAVSSANPKNAVSEEALAAEDVYPFISSGSYMPALGPLAGIFEQGSWIWTASAWSVSKQDNGNIEFTFGFPEWHTHNIIIKGVKPFRWIRMFDTNWPGDPNFQDYTTGWHYDKENQVLMIKMRNKLSSEKVIIGYTDPLPSAPQPPAAAGTETAPVENPEAASQ